MLARSTRGRGRHRRDDGLHGGAADSEDRVAGRERWRLASTWRQAASSSSRQRSRARLGCLLRIIPDVVVYTMWLKRGPPQNIVIGGRPALPAGDRLGRRDRPCARARPLLLFLIIFFWTPPHFWALSLRRAGEYARAGVPMLPVVAGVAEPVARPSSLCRPGSACRRGSWGIAGLGRRRRSDPSAGAAMLALGLPTWIRVPEQAMRARWAKRVNRHIHRRSVGAVAGAPGFSARSACSSIRHLGFGMRVRISLDGSAARRNPGIVLTASRKAAAAAVSIADRAGAGGVRRAELPP